jgi:hypothetical protein
MFPHSGRGLFLVDQFFRPVGRRSRRAEQQIVLEDPVDLDLPKVSNESLSVRRHDLHSMTFVSELAGRGHSAIGYDVEIRRLLRHGIAKVIHNSAKIVPLAAA